MILIILFSLLFAANFTVYPSGDIYELEYSSEEKIRIVCDINWFQKPINCKPIFPDGFNFNAGSGSFTIESGS